MDNSKTYILSTAPLAPSLTDKLLPDGFALDVVPFIATRPVNESKLVGQIAEILSQPATIIFTSTNALNAVIANCPHAHKDIRVYCVGGSTASLAQKYFGEDALAGMADNAAMLADLISTGRENRHLVFFCGNKRRDELPHLLHMAGINVREVVVYETTETPQKINRPYDAILFYSPSGVQSFFSCNTVVPATALFAIGNTTAATLKEFTNNTITISGHPGREQLLDMAIAYFQQDTITG